uniref:Protein kinase domain-containing protein n=2 Tax=Aegilops tauschii subsp. strangulata TaxID=200361 RepID=A0A453Q980_AEGTS
MTGARGTIGFIAPEVHSRTFGVVSTKSDVYSYGMMLLEMVGGRRNVKSVVENSSKKYFPDWIYDHFAQDEALKACDVTSETVEIARKMTLIGLWCVQVLPVYRPTITGVLEMFERSLDELGMPPKQNFCELVGSSAHNTDVQTNASCTIARSEKISAVNSEILQRSSTL